MTDWFELQDTLYVKRTPELRFMLSSMQRKSSLGPELLESDR